MRSRSVGAVGEFVGRRPLGATQHAVEFVGEQLDDVLGVVDAATRLQATARLEQAAAHEPARPVPAQPADVLALAMSVAGLDHEFVEERPMLLRKRGLGSLRRLRLGDIELLGGTEQRRQLQRRDLGQRGPVDVVGGDRAPRVQVEPGVDGGSGVGAQRPHVVDRSERTADTPHASMAQPPDAHHGGLDRGRRAARE